MFHDDHQDHEVEEGFKSGFNAGFVGGFIVACFCCGLWWLLHG